MPALASAPFPSAHGEPSLHLPRSFWKDLSRKYWNRGAALFQRPFAADFPSTADIFEVLLETGERIRRGDFAQPIRFYLEHERGPGGMPYYTLLMNLFQHMPVREDGNMEGYVARLDTLLGGQRFGIVLNRAHCFQWNHWRQLRSFLAGAHETFGVPLGGSESCIFVGNYQYTPFGVHKDDLHNFYLVIEGQKTLSLWPFDTLSSRPEVPKDDPQLENKSALIHLRDQEDERQVLSQALTLKGSPGDLMYWPPSYWHRAEPSTGLVISASFGLVYRPPPFANMAPSHAWPERLRHTELPGGRRWQVPAPVRNSVRQRSQRKNQLAAERESTSEWVRFLTAGTLDGAPPEAKEAPLTSQDWIRAAPERPIAGVPLPGGQVLVSANGRSNSLPASPAVRRRVEQLLTALNSGKPQQVEALEEAFFSRLTARSLTRRAFRSLLDDLVRWRGLQRCEPPRARRGASARSR